MEGAVGAFRVSVCASGGRAAKAGMTRWITRKFAAHATIAPKAVPTKNQFLRILAKRLGLAECAATASGAST